MVDRLSFVLSGRLFVIGLLLLVSLRVLRVDTDEED